MNALYGLIQTGQKVSRMKASRKDSPKEALAGFKALKFKEKCLYLMKISKRNTGSQALILMGLTLFVIGFNYLISMII